MAKRICSIPDCGGTHEAFGYCRHHYKKFRHYGDPLAASNQPAKEHHYWDLIEYGPNCWTWRGGIGGSYGSYAKIPAHRLAYQLAYGPIPEGLEIHHKCKNKMCVNPAHLEALTPKEHAHVEPRNPLGGAVNPPKTHCLRGHPYDEENTMWHKQGYRVCRACRAVRESKGSYTPYRA